MDTKAGRAVKDIIYWDTFGAFGGVGLASRCLIAAFDRRNIKTTLVGESRLIDTYGSQMDVKSTEFVRVETKKHSLKGLWLRFCRKYAPDLASDSKDGFALLRQRNLLAPIPAARTNILINVPHYLPPTAESGFSILVHDLNWRHYPENFPWPHRIDNWCKAWIEQSRLVFTNSEFTRQEIIAEYGTAAEKVIAAPFARDTYALDGGNDAQILQRLGLSANQYYVFPSTVAVHKGHDWLMAELKLLERCYPVVFVGPHTDGEALPLITQKPYFETYKQALSELSGTGKIMATGVVSEDTMQALQKNCRAFVLPSRYEGFGFPMLEAMHHDKPVICSSIPAHLELLGRYAGRIRNRLFELQDKGSLAALLEQDFSDQLTYELFPANEKTDVNWSWDRTAARIIESMASAQEG